MLYGDRERAHTPGSKQVQEREREIKKERQRERKREGERERERERDPHPSLLFRHTNGALTPAAFRIHI